MNQFEVIMPKMGESIEEATITKWFVKPGDPVKEDDILLEIATDKVDSEIPSPVEGIVKKILYQQDEIVPVGSVIAIIDLSGSPTESPGTEEKIEPASLPVSGSDDTSENVLIQGTVATVSEEIIPAPGITSGGRFYSPLVRKIAKEENISLQELENIKGSGRDGRLQKNDLINYLKTGKRISPPASDVSETQKLKQQSLKSMDDTSSKPVISSVDYSGDEIIQMDRVRKIIAEHMVRSKQVSAHVTNVIEVDVTDVVRWRNKIKDDFEKRENQKITYLPVFMEAVIRGIKDYPMINSSVENESIIIKKRINLGIAVALPNFNLIVPVIKNADTLNLTGLTKELNRLAAAARSSKLKPDEIQDGTFTITNFGSFKNIIGTPIINQPQAAILAVGSIEKKPAVLETPQGDVIAIRHKMYLSLTYDHRIIDGSLGGSFLRKVGDYIESFDISRTI